MCLDAHAHGLRDQHEIFNKPHAVTLTITEETKPKAYRTRGEEGAATMPMWRVQTEGYLDRTGQLIGVVSNGDGFLDSPDAESICSGVNSKNDRAVAIGRHGNILHWGFAASPTFLTDEAKLVFVNAVHYIAGFSGHKLIAKKKKGTMTRAAIRRIVDSMSDESYANTVAYYTDIQDNAKARKKALKARLDAGEDLSRRERSELNRPAPKIPGRFDRVRRFLSEEEIERFGDDAKAIREHFATNMKFFRPSGYYRFGIDEEAKKLGVGSNDSGFLKSVVARLGEGGESARLARVLLLRYTDQKFDNDGAWAMWLKKNQARLFYTEAGGYKWLVDTRS